MTDIEKSLLMAVADLAVAIAKQWDAVSIGKRMREVERISEQAQREQANPPEAR